MERLAAMGATYHISRVVGIHSQSDTALGAINKHSSLS